MLNIQFMTEANAVPHIDNWSGKETVWYVPNYEALLQNASCPEEAEAIKSISERKAAFPFKIVFMSYAKTLDPFTCKWSRKWQIMQFPWDEGHSEEEMISIIEKTLV